MGIFFSLSRSLTICRKCWICLKTSLRFGQRTPSQPRCSSSVGPWSKQTHSSGLCWGFFWLWLQSVLDSMLSREQTKKGHFSQKRIFILYFINWSFTVLALDVKKCKWKNVSNQVFWNVTPSVQYAMYVFPILYTYILIKSFELFKSDMFITEWALQRGDLSAVYRDLGVNSGTET